MADIPRYLTFPACTKRMGGVNNMLNLLERDQ